MIKPDQSLTEAATVAISPHHEGLDGYITAKAGMESLTRTLAANTGSGTSG